MHFQFVVLFDREDTSSPEMDKAFRTILGAIEEYHAALDAREGASDVADELPGMWEPADLAGGETDVAKPPLPCVGTHNCGGHCGPGCQNEDVR